MEGNADLKQRPDASENPEFPCLYCCPDADINGTIIIIPRSKLVIFTPSEQKQEINKKFQCIIHLNDCFELGTVSSPQGGTGDTTDEQRILYYLQLQFRVNDLIDDLILRNIFFRFFSKSEMVNCTRILLDLKQQHTDDYDPSITQIPFYSDHLNFSPIVSPETKDIGKKFFPRTSNEDDHRPLTPSPRAGGSGCCGTFRQTSKKAADVEDSKPTTTSNLMLSPPRLSVLSVDKSAVEFSGRFLVDEHAELIADVRELLPLEFRFAEWRLVYSPKIHGISIPSFYRHFESSRKPSVVVVTDAKRDCVFGSFCRFPWNADNQRKYFGSNENFLFSLMRGGIVRTQYHPWSPSSNNTLFQYSDDRKIVIGGGRSGSGLVLFDNWLRGISSPCETFATDRSLCCTNDFVVGDVEFWALITDGDYGHPTTMISRP